MIRESRWVLEFLESETTCPQIIFWSLLNQDFRALTPRATVTRHRLQVSPALRKQGIAMKPSSAEAYKVKKRSPLTYMKAIIIKVITIYFWAFLDPQNHLS